MKTIKILFLSILFAATLTACDKTEREKATGEKVTGTVQETVGNATNNDSLKSEGKENQLKGDLRSTKEDVKDMVTGK